MASASTASATAATGAGLGAWLMKGGWAAVLAGLLVAAGIAVGGYFLFDDFEWPTLPSVTDEASDTLEGEATEDSAEASTEGQPLPPPVVEDFSAEDILSLFSVEQGSLSVSESGELVVDAEWETGDENFSTLCFDPREVAGALGDERVPGAILIKLLRDSSSKGEITAYLGSNALGRNQDTTVPVYLYSCYRSSYEYVVVELNGADPYEWASTPAVYLKWLDHGDAGFPSDGKRMTVSEIIFYADIWEAFLATEGKLEADGVKHPPLRFPESGTYYDTMIIQVPFFYLEPMGPKGKIIPMIAGEPYTDSKMLRVAVFHEGVEHIKDRIMIGNDFLQAVYLPDSLKRIDGDPFNFCSSLTRVRIGSGIEFIDSSAFDFSLTDVDYNGTMEQWCKVDRDRNGGHHITVHCLDGDIPYGATEPDYGQAEAAKEALAWSTPMALAEGQLVMDMESAYLKLSNGAGLQKQVILRWALTERADVERLPNGGRYDFYFDVLDPADGTILYLPDAAEIGAYNRMNGSSLFLSKEAGEEGGPDTASVFLVGYGFTEGGDSFRMKTSPHIVLVHETYQQTVDMLPWMIEYLREQGCTFATPDTLDASWYH
jgi:hypothetical protein